MIDRNPLKCHGLWQRSHLNLHVFSLHVHLPGVVNEWPINFLHANLGHSVSGADLVRIGSLRRIDKRLLPHSLHARQDKGKGDAASELADMLRTCTSASEAIILRQELAEVSSIRPSPWYTAVGGGVMGGGIPPPRKPPFDGGWWCRRVGGGGGSTSAQEASILCQVWAEVSKS